jgi:CheY-like chemotaxis protein
MRLFAPGCGSFCRSMWTCAWWARPPTAAKPSTWCAAGHRRAGLMDLSMPGQSGLDALAMLRAKAPHMGILILSGYPEEHYAINLIRQGPAAISTRNASPPKSSRPSAPSRWASVTSRPPWPSLLAQQLNRKDDAPPHEQLSEREFQVFLKLAKGETAGDIAKDLVAEREDREHLPHAPHGKNGPVVQQRPDVLRAQEPADRLMWCLPPWCCAPSPRSALRRNAGKAASAARPAHG